MLYAAGALSAFEKAVAAHLARHGPIDGESFHFLRKTAGLTAADLAPHFGVTPETISRRESGRRAVNRAAWLVVGTFKRGDTWIITAIPSDDEAKGAPAQREVVVENAPSLLRGVDVLPSAPTRVMTAIALPQGVDDVDGDFAPLHSARLFATGGAPLLGGHDVAPALRRPHRATCRPPCGHR